MSDTSKNEAKQLFSYFVHSQLHMRTLRYNHEQKCVHVPANAGVRLA
jgi:hypothetical protein